MRGIDRLAALLSAFTLLRLYTPRNLLLLSAFALGYGMTNMVIHPYQPPPDPLHPVWEKNVENLKSQKRYDEALKLVNQHLQADPNSYLGYQVRAGIFSNMGKYQESSRDHDLAIAKLTQQVRKSQALCTTNQAKHIYACHLPRP